MGIFSACTPYNPNVILTCSLDKINLPSNKIYWPRAEIEIFNQKELKYFSSQNLVDCDDSINMVWLKGYEHNLYGNSLIKKGVKGVESNTATLLKGADVQQTVLKEVEYARNNMFRGSVRGKEWENFKLNQQHQIMNISKVIQLEEGSQSDDNELMPMRKGFDNPNNDQNINESLFMKGQLGGSFIPNTNNNDKKSVSLKNKNEKLRENKEIEELDLEKARIPNVYLEELEPLNLINSSKKQYTKSGSYNGFSIICRSEERRVGKEC